MAALCGPFGAAAGGILSLITGIIAAIMEALNPEKESLESRIKQIIKEESLSNMTVKLAGSENTWIANGEIFLDNVALIRKAVAEAADAGQPFVKTSDKFWPKGYTPEMLREGMAWEDLKSATEYTKGVEDINGALKLLADNKDLHSEEWGALMDQTVGYMFRMWVSLHGLAGLVNQDGRKMFNDMLREIAGQFKEKLDEMSFAAQNSCQLYHRWRSADYVYYGTMENSIGALA